MRAPPAKPFAIVFLVGLGLFIVWAIVGGILEPRLTDPELREQVRRIVLPISFALFLMMAFSAAPVMIHLFLALLLKVQEAAGNLDHPLIRQIKDGRETIAAVLIYVFWSIFALGMLISLPFAYRDMMAQ